VFRNYFVFIIFFLSSEVMLVGQNKSIADSCLKILNSETIDNDSVRFRLISRIAFNQPKPDSIIFYAQCLIDQKDKKINKYFLSKGHYLKAIGLFRQSSFNKALEELIQSVEIAQSINDDYLTAISYLQMGSVYSSMENYPCSLDSYFKAIKYLNKTDDPEVLSAAYLNLGGEFYSHNNYDSALVYYGFAKDIYSNLNYRHGKAYADGNIGIILAKKDELDSAKQKLKSSCEVLLVEGDLQSYITFVIWIAIIDLKSENFSESLYYLEEALLIALRNDYKEQIRDSYDQLANVYSAMGRYQEANEALKNYYAYRDSIVNTETITKIANLRTDFEVGQKQAELDVVRAQDSFKTKVAWFLAVVLLGAVVFVYVHYRQYRYNQRLTVLLKRQNHERQQQKIALEAAVAAKDRLFSVIAHDLRGPVGAMGNLVILANDAMANNEWGDLQSILIMMGDSNREVENLLNSLLHWSIGQRGTYTTKVEAVDFSRLVQSVIDVYLPIAFAKGVHISFVPQYEEHLIETDLNSWAVIVRNLVNNAVKFTHLGGVVTVTAQQYPDYLALKVSDTGIGMDPHLAQNVFSSSVNQSQWGTASEKGLGIGLSLVKDFVEMNDGQIQVESQLGQGTTFTVTIPVNVLKATPFVAEMV